MDSWLGDSRLRKTRWLTPRWVTDPLGDFDLDPAGAPDHEIAKTTYIPERGEDGLSLPWFGRVWLNPPYGRDAHPFIERLVQHGNGIAFVFVRADAKWFHNLILGKAHSVFFLAKRVTFLNPDGTVSGNNSGAASCLVSYGSENTDVITKSTLPGKTVYLRKWTNEQH